MEKIFLSLLAALAIFHHCACSSDLSGLKRQNRQTKDREKSDFRNALTGAQAGAAIGKAFGPTRTAVAAFIGAIACAILCSDPPPPPPPPTISCYSLSPSIYYAEEGQTTATVDWSMPTSPDGSVGKVAGPDPGTALQEGSYDVTYAAASNTGHSSPCVLSFTVIVHKCSRPLEPANGRLTCDRNPPVYGDNCHYECDKGYIGTGSSTQKCEENGFNGTEFSCSKVSCGEPQQPDNANISCPDGHLYTSVCAFPCKEGYKRDGNIGSALCTEDGTWSPALVTDCRDAVPPELHNCPSHFTAYVGPDQIHAVIEYTPPTASDTLDGSVAVTLIKGYESGASVAINRSHPENNQHTIVYTAIDSGGLEAIPLCQFTVVVADLTCEPLPSQPKMNTTCSEPLYIYNSKCDFTCFSGYPLEGLQSVTCEKYPDRNEVYWNWGEGNEPTKCIVQDCPDLEPPLNGAMGCVPVSSGKHCTMSCNDNFDIPRTAPALGSFFCDDAVGWLDGDEAPDCTEIRRPNRYNLPVEFYYSGDCNSDDVLEQIKQHVIATTLDSKYKSLCERSEDCTVENVNVTCGEITQKKMQTTTIIVTFEFSVAYTFESQLTINEQFKKLEDAVYNMFDIFLSDMQNGLLDLVELNLIADSSTLAAGYDDLVCPFGLTPEYTTLTCLSCPIGTMYDAVVDDCMKCPIGTYQDQDAQTSCIHCPDGFSTVFRGSKYAHECKGMCPPGSISHNGIVPCYLCNIGTYQETIGQSSCDPCPVGTNSTIQGSNSLLNCKSDNDVCMQESICGEHGVCVPDIETEEDYSCVCTEGYTGDNCTLPPSPCQHNTCQNEAECIPQGNGYTCNCMSGYTGDKCQHQIVDGGWTPFESWSLCSGTCGYATQTRSRSCSSPKPQNGGLDCEGEAIETRTCDLNPCPACPKALKPYKGAVEEVIIDSVHTAVLSCPNYGYILSGAPAEYECGSHTNYIWKPFVTRRELPKCIEVQPAQELSVEAKFEYHDISINEGNTVVIGQKIEEILEQSPCMVSNICEMNIVVEEAQPGRRKRNNGYDFVVLITLRATINYDAYFVDGVLQMETVNATLPDYIARMTELELSMQRIENATTDESLAVVIGGQVYLPDPDSFIASGKMVCPEGRQALSGFCVTCPPGSREVNGACVLCDVGFYQDKDGQRDCIACPEGQSTEYTGSVDSDACIHHQFTASPTIDRTTTSTNKDILDATPQTDHTDKKGHKESDQLIYLATLAIVPVNITIAALIWCCCKKGGKIQDESSSHDNGRGEANHFYYGEGQVNLKGGSSIDSKAIMSPPPDYYSIRPLTASDVEIKS